MYFSAGLCYFVIFFKQHYTSSQAVKSPQNQSSSVHLCFLYNFPHNDWVSLIYGTTYPPTLCCASVSLSEVKETVRLVFTNTVLQEHTLSFHTPPISVSQVQK